MKHVWLTLTMVAFVVGCSGDKPAEKAPEKAPAAEPAKEAPKAEAAPEPVKPADPVAEAKTIFGQRCVVCPGEKGDGSGPGAAALKPKPRNYGDAEWQAKVTDETLAKTIVEGGAATGLSPLMPANPDLMDKPEIVAEIVKIIRSFAPAPEAAK